MDILDTKYLFSIYYLLSHNIGACNVLYLLKYILSQGDILYAWLTNSLSKLTDSLIMLLVAHSLYGQIA